MAMMLGRLLTTIISVALVWVGLELSGPNLKDVGSIQWWAGLVLTLAGVLLSVRMIDVANKEDKHVSGED
jgi:membrane associated rhomboid family serine protease